MQPACSILSADVVCDRSVGSTRAQDRDSRATVPVSGVPGQNRVRVVVLVHDDAIAITRTHDVLQQIALTVAQPSDDAVTRTSGDPVVDDRAPALRGDKDSSAAATHLVAEQVAV